MRREEEGEGLALYLWHTKPLFATAGEKQRRFPPGSDLFTFSFADAEEPSLNIQ